MMVHIFAVVCLLCVYLLCAVFGYKGAHRGIDGIRFVRCASGSRETLVTNVTN